MNDMTRPALPVATQPANHSVGLTDSAGFELAQRAAKALAASTLVPKEYQNNLPNCIIALNMAARVGADPLMVMQNLVVVHGKPTWSAQFLIATVNTCGRFSALRYEFFGEKGADTWGCRAHAIERATGERLVGSDITIAIAKKEGWYGKSGSKWQSIPQQMLIYRAGAWWTRAYAPELSMGLQSTEEQSDVIDYADDGSFTVSQQAHQASAAPRDITPVDTFMDQADFERKCPEWVKLITSGKKTAEQIIATIRTKELLTDQQMEAIHAIGKTDATTPDQAEIDRQVNAALDADLAAGEQGQ